MRIPDFPFICDSLSYFTEYFLTCIIVWSLAIYVSFYFILKSQERGKSQHRYQLLVTKGRVTLGRANSRMKQRLARNMNTVDCARCVLSQTRARVSMVQSVF